MKNKKDYICIGLLMFIVIVVLYSSRISLIRIEPVSFKMFLLLILLLIYINNVTIKYKENLTNYIVNSTYVFVILLTIFITINNFFITVTKVSGDSMLPNLKNNELLVVNYSSNYERFDIVIIEIEGELVVKRLVGLPGENIKISGNDIFINNKKQTISHNIEGTNTKNVNITLGDGEYFVLGDNLSNSHDSRYYDEIRKNNIKGKVLFK